MMKSEIALNYPRLPDFTSTELNYRPRAGLSDSAQRAHVLSLFIQTVIGALVLTVVLRVTGWNLMTPMVLAGIGLTCLVVGAGYGFIRKDLRVFLYWLLGGLVAGPVAWLLGQVLAVWFLVVPAAIAAALGLAWLVDRMTAHHFGWTLADPRYSGLLEDERKKAWINRFHIARRRAESPRIQAICDQVAARDQPHAPYFHAVANEIARPEWYLLALASPLVFVVAAVHPTFLTFALASIAPLVILVLWCLSARGENGATTKQLITLTYRVLCGWFNYARDVPDAPGVYRSPLGTPRRRACTAIAVYSLFVVTLLPAMRYMPLLLTLTTRAEHDRVVRPSTSRTGGSIAPNSEADGHPLLSTYAPEAWLRAAIGNDVRQTTVGYSLLTAAAACMLYPPLLFFTALLGATRSSLLTLHQGIELPGGADRTTPPDDVPWSIYERRLRTSKNAVEQEHLWVGAHYLQDYPVLVHQDILKEHAYVVGDSGSGKTALGLLNLVPQFIRRRNAAVVILDLKGDNALFQTVREECVRTGAPFRFFTNELGRHTHAFNPFVQADPSRLTVNQVCETMLEALSLNHGDGYGRSYYSRIARRWLHSMLRQYPSLDSFEELYELSDNPESFRDEKERQDAFELVSVIESLASFEQINITPKRPNIPSGVVDEAIYMPRVIAEREVVYFWLPAAVETATVREVAKLALYSLLRAAHLHNRDKAEPDQTFLVIDEFQRIASGNFKVVLEQARSMGVGAILANQTPADLVTADADLRATVQTNTRFKLCFAASDLAQQDDLMKASGEESGWLRSYSVSDKGSSSGFSETIQSRLRRNDVIALTDDPMGCVAHIARGAGYSQYHGLSLPVSTIFTMSKDRYDALRARAWPSDERGTFLTTRRALDPEAFLNAAQRRRAVDLFLDEDAPRKGSLVTPVGRIVDDEDDVDADVAETLTVEMTRGDSDEGSPDSRRRAKVPQSAKSAPKSIETPKSGGFVPESTTSPQNWVERIWAAQDLINQRRNAIAPDAQPD